MNEKASAANITTVLLIVLLVASEGMRHVTETNICSGRYETLSKTLSKIIYSKIRLLVYIIYK